MAKQSAGVLLYRRRARAVEVLLVHPGGPFWANRDEGAWSLPKGELQADEDHLAAARREFAEETGHTLVGDFTPLASVRLKSGKVIHAFAIEGDLDPSAIHSNFFETEWPPRSGVLRQYPEVDRAAFFSLSDASAKLHPGQIPFLERLATLLEAACGEP